MKKYSKRATKARRAAQTQETIEMLNQIDGEYWKLASGWGLERRTFSNGAVHFGLINSAGEHVTFMPIRHIKEFLEAFKEVV